MLNYVNQPIRNALLSILVIFNSLLVTEAQSQEEELSPVAPITFVDEIAGFLT